MSENKKSVLILCGGGPAPGTNSVISTLAKVFLNDNYRVIGIHGLDIKTRPSELGYELRCCRPIGFDLTLCTLLGIGVKKNDQGKSGCLVSANSKGEISPLYLKVYKIKTGKSNPV